MDNVKRFGFVPDRVYDHDKFGVVGPLTEGTIYVEATHFDASQASVVALKAENEALLKGLTGKNALTGTTYAHLIEERDALRRHLHEATTSLETISKLAWRDEFMKHMSQVCGYAGSRARVARAFMDAAVDEGAPKTSAVCTWVGAEDAWVTGCGKEWTFHEDGPAENGMNFCHACGKPVAVEESAEEAAGDE